MKNRYKVIRHINPDSWQVWSDKLVDSFATREEARAACKKLNAQEQQGQQERQPAAA